MATPQILASLAEVSSGLDWLALVTHLASPGPGSAARLRHLAHVLRSATAENLAGIESGALADLLDHADPRVRLAALTLAIRLPAGPGQAYTLAQARKASRSAR